MSDPVRSPAFRRSILLALLIAVLRPLPSAAETYILPARADLGFAMATVSMPLGDYTNCVAYYTAEAPVFNAGQTNYFVPDLTPAKNDATNTTIDKQPALVVTNGTPAFLYDATTDFLQLSNQSLLDPLMATGQFMIDFDFLWLSSGLASYDRVLQFSTSTGFFRFQRGSGTTTTTLWARHGAGLDVYPPRSVEITPDAFHRIRIAGDGQQVSIAIDGAVISSGNIGTNYFAVPTWTYQRIGDSSYSPPKLLKSFRITTNQ